MARFVRAKRAAAKVARKRRFRRLRKNRKQRENVVNRSMVPLGLGLPKRILVTHKYREFVTSTSTTGIATVYRFSCNGMFDPNITGTGHQPLYFDQLSAMYNHYTVIGSKATLKLIPTTSTTAATKFAFIINDDTVSTPTTIDGLAEQSKGSSWVVPAASNNPRTMSKTWSAKKTFGGSVLANDELKGDPTANPAEQSYFQLNFQAADETATVAFFVEWAIEYIAVWSELKDIAQS